MSKVIGSLERGWLPDYPDLGGCTVEQNGVSPELELSGKSSVKIMHSNSMTHSDLISRLAKLHPQLKIKDAENAVNVNIDALSNTLSKGDRIEMRGFGSFALNYRQARIGRNPKTGERVQVPAKYVPHFKAGQELKKSLRNV
jgi:integration host factor subunit beta